MKKLLASLCLALSLFSLSCQPQDTQPRRTRVLFLGHTSEHHPSADYAPLLSRSLFRDGIEVNYTEDPNDLNEATLAPYDVLLLYANHDSITPSQEKALLQFVKGGKGFLPIHCASYCFRNSPEFVALVGAQFQSHDTATFQAQLTDAHPITAGYEPGTFWDETYVHHQHNPDRTVLMERVYGTEREPWTWVREYGKGRVFYTASGHDERAWSNPQFQELIARAIRWAAGDRVEALRAAFKVPTLQYSPAATIPNYEQRDPAPQLQAPLSRAESEKLIQLPPGFELRCFAEEPDVINPIALSWDEKGRLWVLETVDYPNEVNPTHKGDDRIKICEDTDGDGRADKFTVFAEGLNIPTSIMNYRDGVVVAMAPYFLHFRDLNGDDRADQVDTLITGWGLGDTHAGPSNLKYGFDNQIWGCLGYSGFEGEIFGKPYDFGQGFYRFSPEQKTFEYLTRTSNNTWGLAFSETFDVFGSTANNAQSWYLAIPDRYLLHAEGIPHQGSRKIAQYYDFHPVTPNFRQVDVFGGFTAAAGHNLYTARLFPKNYWNRIALINEPTGNLLAEGVIESDGAGFKTLDGWNLLASADEWVSPVHAEVGPDGAVWVADWYNFIVQHNPTPRPDRGGYQAELGTGNAHINPLRDRTHGRIYRIYPTGTQFSRPQTLERDDPASLLAGLKSDNLFWRMTAQRLLVERGQADVKNKLIALVTADWTDEIGLNGPAIHALWTLHGLGLMGDQEVITAVTKALQHPAAGVRKAAIQVLPRDAWVWVAFQDAGVLEDADLHTRLAAYLALAEFSPYAPIGQEAYRLSQLAENQQDNWLEQSLYVVALRHREGFLQTLEREGKIAAAAQEVTESFTNPLSSQQEELADWKEMAIPSLWENAGLPDVDGIVWFYKTFTLPRKAPVDLHLGPIDDIDSTYVNGVLVGGRLDYQNPRHYKVPASATKAGQNLLVIRVVDGQGGGGLIGTAAQYRVQQGAYQQSLAGNWRYEVEKQTNVNTSLPVFASAEEFIKIYLKHYGPGAVSMAQQIDVPSDPNALRIEVATVKDAMKYDRELIEVPAGKAIELVFRNQDLMQHNWLLLTVGSLEKVGLAADQLAQQPDGQEKEYIPSLPEVMYASGLVDPGKEVVVRFTAPAKPGDYPYVCTFPGHWKVMNGILRVK